MRMVSSIMGKREEKKRRRGDGEADFPKQDEEEGDSTERKGSSSTMSKKVSSAISLRLDENTLINDGLHTSQIRICPRSKRLITK